MDRPHQQQVEPMGALPGGGPSMLYQMQAPAYVAARSYAPTVTDSTASQPPSFSPADVSSAAARKREVVQDLPRSCKHCGGSWTGTSPKRIFHEMNDGTIMAYCRPEGGNGCGRSRVLFVQPDLRVPRYEQVCVFEAVQDHPKLSDPTFTLHGITPPEVTCAKCRKPYHKHHHDYDSNGWRIAGHDTLPLPVGWPTWQPATGTWTTTPSSSSSSASASSSS